MANVVVELDYIPVGSASISKINLTENNNSSTNVVSKINDGRKAFVWGASKWGEKAEFINKFDGFVSRIMSYRGTKEDIHNGDFGHYENGVWVPEPIQLTLEGNNINHVHIKYAPLMKQFAKQISVDGKLFFDEDCHIIATNLDPSLESHTILIYSWSAPGFNCRITSITLGIQAAYTNREITQVVVGNRMTDTDSAPYYGVIGQYGNIELKDSDSEIRDLANLRMLTENTGVIVKVNDGKECVFKSEKWSCIDNKITSDLKDSVLAWHDIDFAGVTLAVDSMNVLDLFNRIKSRANNVFVIDGIEKKANEPFTATSATPTLFRMNSTNIFYCFLESSSLWDAFNKICLVCGAQIYENNDGKVTLCIPELKTGKPILIPADHVYNAEMDIVRDNIIDAVNVTHSIVKVAANKLPLINNGYGGTVTSIAMNDVGEVILSRKDAGREIIISNDFGKSWETQEMPASYSVKISEAFANYDTITLTFLVDGENKEFTYRKMASNSNNEPTVFTGDTASNQDVSFATCLNKTISSFVRIQRIQGITFLIPLSGMYWTAPSATSIGAGVVSVDNSISLGEHKIKLSDINNNGKAVFVSETGGVFFRDSNTEFGEEECYFVGNSFESTFTVNAVSINDSGSCVASGISSSSNYRLAYCTNMSASWYYATISGLSETPTESELYFVGVKILNDGKCMAVNRLGQIAKSYDSGKSYQVVGTIYDNCDNLPIGSASSWASNAGNAWYFNCLDGSDNGDWVVLVRTDPTGQTSPQGLNVIFRHHWETTADSKWFGVLLSSDYCNKILINNRGQVLLSRVNNQTAVGWHKYDKRLWASEDYGKTWKALIFPSGASQNGLALNNNGNYIMPINGNQVTIGIIPDNPTEKTVEVSEVSKVYGNQNSQNAFTLDSCEIVQSGTKLVVENHPENKGKSNNFVYSRCTGSLGSYSYNAYISTAANVDIQCKIYVGIGGIYGRYLCTIPAGSLTSEKVGKSFFTHISYASEIIPKSNTNYVFDSDYVFFISESGPITERIANYLLSTYKDGRQFATLDVDVLDYYYADLDANGFPVNIDEKYKAVPNNSVLAISPKSASEKSFHSGMIVIPYTSKGALAKRQDGSPKKFQIVSAEFNYSGRPRKTLQLLEIVE